MPTHGAWDSTTVSGGTLSNGDKTFTVSSSGSVLSTDSVTSGKHYAEVTINSDAADGAIVAILDSVTPTHYLFITDQGSCIGSEFGTLSYPAPAFTTGDVIGLALDETAQLIWFRINGGDWNNDPSADPVAGVNGYSCAITLAYVSYGGYTGEGATIATGPTFAHAAPSGYDSWYFDFSVSGPGNTDIIAPQWQQDVLEVQNGVLPPGNDGGIGTDLKAWNGFKDLLQKSVTAGSIFSATIVSTYSLAYTTTTVYNGGVLAPNGDIHFVPYSANRGQKISASGVVSTYSLVYTNASGAYVGGVLAPNGDIHFVPYSANRGQKISASGVVSTYSLVKTGSGLYAGGVLDPNGNIHLVPTTSDRGQKISITGAVSTYSLVYTNASGAYVGGVLAPNGDIHFVPYNATVGQKISSAGVVSTYSLVYTTSTGYFGAAVSPNGDIHFVPFNATVGQKVSVSGTVSTYSLAYTTPNAFNTGVLAPNGDIHFVPYWAARGQKISSTGVVSTYSLVYTNGTGAYIGGVLTSTGSIYFVPYSATVGQQIFSTSALPFGIGTLCSPWLNKF